MYGRRGQSQSAKINCTWSPRVTSWKHIGQGVNRTNALMLHQGANSLPNASEHPDIKSKPDKQGTALELETPLLCPQIIFVHCKHSSSKRQDQPTKHHGQLKHNHSKSKSAQETNRPSSKKRKPIWLSRLAQAHISDMTIPKMDLNRRAIGLFFATFVKMDGKQIKKLENQQKRCSSEAFPPAVGLYGSLATCVIHLQAHKCWRMLKVWVRQEFQRANDRCLNIRIWIRVPQRCARVTWVTRGTSWSSCPRANGSNKHKPELDTKQKCPMNTKKPAGEGEPTAFKTVLNKSQCFQTRQNSETI